ncbi:hypothetical protein N7462_010073 [Penicillium macrosclerotiorum]|uniref:uncharacterized protein n=1 Tax=Penicillium macrosclerotiorum TaxID=303699 RepID=UPI00254740A3|nr:uncharacterized protein N7462_010073 [Penicillium macrosclerotiorum]KAJ5669003.1 hypothetical protein N7462_010073 [Penicillium macrosclerotiorum]
MGVVGFLLKVILVPIALFIGATIVIIILIKMHREKKAKKRELENNSFRPPPLQQWAMNSPIVQKPPAAFYSTNTPSQMEQGVVRPS